MLQLIKKATLLTVLASLGISWMGCYGQPTGLVKNKKFDKRLSFMLDSTKVPFISVEEVRKHEDEYILLDARSKEEYNVSHIPGAKWIGEDGYKLEDFNQLNHSKTLVVYCSVGYRSQVAAEEIKTFGFDQIYNLYGSIFEWANRSYPLEDDQGNKTNNLHTYNDNWAKWIFNEEIDKVN